MEFPFNCEKALSCDSNGFSVLHGSRPPVISKTGQGYKQVKDILDDMGEASTKVRI
jgi:hypothetical protein